MHGIKVEILKAIKIKLHNTVVIGSVTIPYFPDYFGTVDEGIYLQSYQEDNADNKHFEGSLVTFTIVIFAKDKTVDYVTEASRQVRTLLKASVADTLTLGNGYSATYTDIVVMSSETLNNEGAIEHRDSIRFEVSVNENTNES